MPGLLPPPRAADRADTYTARRQEPALTYGAMARREEVCVSMEDAHAHPPRFSVDQLTAVREWIWRHSSQPNGDPWDSDPEHLDRAAQNLLSDLAQRFTSTNPQPASATHPPLTPHPLVDAHGLPLNTLVSAADRHDSPLVEPIPHPMPTIRRGGRGRPRGRPVEFHRDEDHDALRVRRYLRHRGFSARIARIGRDSSARLGRHGWVERIHGWLLSYKRLALH